MRNGRILGINIETIKLNFFAGYTFHSHQGSWCNGEHPWLESCLTFWLNEECTAASQTHCSRQSRAHTTSSNNDTGYTDTRTTVQQQQLQYRVCTTVR